MNYPRSVILPLTDGEYQALVSYCNEQNSTIDPEAEPYTPETLALEILFEVLELPLRVSVNQ